MKLPADLLGLIDAANVFGGPAIVRVPGHDVGGAGRVIDAGPIAQRCADAGIPAGIYTGSIELSAAPISWGYSFMPIASDYSLLSTATRGVLAEYAAAQQSLTGSSR